MIKSKHYIDYSHARVEQDLIFKPSEEAKICLNCDLPECTNKRNCPRFKEEKSKLKRKGK